jgi:hypothetical protein
MGQCMCSETCVEGQPGQYPVYKHFGEIGKLDPAFIMHTNRVE